MIRPARRIAVSVLVAAILGVVALSVGASVAAAKSACARQILNEWADNRQISTTYPLHCYREAIAAVPEDLRVYTDIEQDILAARQQAARGIRTLQNRNQTSQSDSQRDPDAGLFTQGFDKLGPNNADSMPLPLIILAGLALLLIAAGAVGLVSRRFRAGRVPSSLVRPGTCLACRTRSPTGLRRRSARQLRLPGG